MSTPPPPLTETVTEPGRWEWVEPFTFRREWLCDPPPPGARFTVLADEWSLSLNDPVQVQRVKLIHLETG